MSFTAILVYPIAYSDIHIFIPPKCHFKFIIPNNILLIIFTLYQNFLIISFLFDHNSQVKKHEIHKETCSYLTGEKVINLRINFKLFVLDDSNIIIC